MAVLEGLRRVGVLNGPDPDPVATSSRWGPRTEPSLRSCSRVSSLAGASRIRSTATACTRSASWKSATTLRQKSANSSVWGRPLGASSSAQRCRSWAQRRSAWGWGWWGERERSHGIS